RACYGCHATQTDAVPNSTIEALKYPPVAIRRKSTDLEYRRNEPEAYRTQARIGEAPKYREWLKSKDPEVQARACEMLMLIEDGAKQDACAIAKLLQSAADGKAQIALRRAAALALTRLATPGQKELLEQVATSNSDWLTAYHAQVAL